MSKGSEQTKKWNRENRERFNANKRKSHHRHKARYNMDRNAKYHTPFGIYRSIRSMCKSGKRTGPFLISESTFTDWYNSSPKNCFYCDIPENLAIKLDKFSRHGQFKRLSIDKMNPDNGYIAGNLVLACYLCNVVKQNILTVEQMREVGQRFIKPVWTSNSALSPTVDISTFL